MAHVIVGHPDADFSGYLRVAGRGLLFTQGFTELVDLTAAQQTELTSTGFTVDGQPDPPVADPFSQYLTEARAATAIGGTGPLGVAGRAALGAPTKVTPPTGFAFTHLTLPPVFRVGGRRFRALLDVQAMRPATGVTYYVDPAAPAGAAGTQAAPMRIGEALLKSDVGTIIYAPGEYDRGNHGSGTGTTVTRSINHLAAAPGVRVTGWNLTGSTTWTVASGSIYQTSRSGTTQVVDVTNRTAWGDYTKYDKKADLASITGPGQWALVGSTVYVWALGNTDLSVLANRVQIRLGVTARTGLVASAGMHYVRGINFEGCDDGGACAQGSAIVIAEDCTFRYSMGSGGVQALGGNGYISIRCEASSNGADGFNYHSSAGVNPDFIEIDCYSHHNGLGSSGDTNNATTCHEETRGLRLNGNYDVADGPVVADVNSAKTWNLGCRAGASTAADAQNHSWRADGQVSTSTPAEMWLDECTADTATYGFKTTSGGVINVSGMKVSNPNATDTSSTGTLRTYQPA